MRYILMAVFVTMFLGCSNTWHGVKKDSTKAAEWTKDKVHDSADWVSEKTN